MKKIIFLIIILIVVLSFAYYLLNNSDATNIVDIKPDEKSDLIVVASPIKDSEISSPLRIAGRARGTGFFEGSFPVELVDQYRNTIAVGFVTSQGEWMTEEFVPFLGSLQFNNYIKGTKGTLILKKANPSDLQENDDSIEIPVIFR